MTAGHYGFRSALVALVSLSLGPGAIAAVPVDAPQAPAERAADAHVLTSADETLARRQPADARPQAPRSGPPRPVYLVLAGGVSLGAYEGGYAATIVRALRENPEDFVLRGIAGTSAGAINAVASALEYCRVDTSDVPTTSVNYDAWAPIDWPMLYAPDKITREALFHHEGLRRHGRSIVEPGRYHLRSDCDISVQVAVTQTLDNGPTSDLDRTNRLVEYLGVRITADAHGDVHYLQLPPSKNSTPPRLALPTNHLGEVSPEDALSIIVASAAFPVGFPTVTMQVCEGTAEHPNECRVVSSRRYHDGGVFENVPVRAVLPYIEQEAVDPLVIVVDLSNQKIPPASNRRRSDLGVGTLAQSWLRFARARDYASAMATLSERGFETWRADQRYPLASEPLSAFAGFLDASFRKVDYALGVHDALLDIDRWYAYHSLPPSTVAVRPEDQCVHDVLNGASISTTCASIVERNVWVALRGIVAAAESRCGAMDVPTMACAALDNAALRDRLPQPPVDAGRARRLANAAGKAPADDYQAFLVELRFGDFVPELAQEWPDLRGRKGRRPEILWSRILEDALRKFANAQAPPRLATQIGLETMLASAIPVLPRPSLSALASLNSLEGTVNLPLSARFSMDVGVTSEWGIRAERAQRWHVFSGGPVVRVGWLFSQRQALVASMLDAHTGVLFGPVLPSIAEYGAHPGDGRGTTRPNAAVFVGLAPRFVLFRRLQADFPVRAYWMCDEPSCVSISNARPGYSVQFRLGWNWTLAPRVKGLPR